jgi:hypothetical protein
MSSLDGKFSISLWLAVFYWTKSLLCNVAFFRDTVILIVYTLVMCFKKTLCRIQDSEVQIPCIHLDDLVFRPDARQSSNIRPDEEKVPSGLPSVPRSFELFQVASVRTSQQNVRMPFNVRQVKGFPFQTQIWEDSCNRPDDVVIPSGCYPW